MPIPLSKLVAHRGHQKYFPENSVLAVMDAIQAGALNVEVDIQINDEGMIFLLHDSNLSRISGVDCCFHSLSTVEAGKLFAYEPDRLGEKFSHNPLNFFAELLPIIRNYKNVNFFIELKQESVDRYGAEACVSCLFDLMEGDIKNCILISYSEDAMKKAKSLGFKQTGLVIKDWQLRESAIKETEVDYIFINYTRIDDKDDIISTVPVIVYETESANIALSLIARGAAGVETFAFNELVAKAL